MWLDEPGSVTTGTAPAVQGLDPTITISHRVFRDPRGVNRSLTYSVDVQREFAVTSTVVTRRGGTRTSTWRQRLSFTTQGNVTAYGQTQVVDFNTTGSDTATSDQTSVYGHDYHYPVAVTQQTTTDGAGALSLSASLDQGLVLQTSGAATYPDGLEAFGTARHGVYATSMLATSRRGVATFRQSADKRSTAGSGRTTQEFAFGGGFQRYYPDLSGSPDVMLYFRNISTDGNDVVRNRVTVSDSAPPGDDGGVVVAAVAAAAAAAPAMQGVSDDDGRRGGEPRPAGKQIIMTPSPAAAGEDGEPGDAAAAAAASGDGAQNWVSGEFAVPRFGPFIGRGGLR